MSIYLLIRYLTKKIILHLEKESFHQMHLYTDILTYNPYKNHNIITSYCVKSVIKIDVI